MYPGWFHWLAIGALTLGVACALIVFVGVLRHPQKMGVMNVVWPVTALFGTVFTVWIYIVWGKASSKQAMERARRESRAMPADSQPYPVIVGKGTLHYGAGCMIGDLIEEWLAFFVPLVAVRMGWQSISDEKIFAVRVHDFIFAFTLGVVFQCFAIRPMRGLTPGKGILAALKAHALSLIAWQVGMYGLMAIAQFWVFSNCIGKHAQVNRSEFWFAMQIAMIAGFLTAYPVNWWLIRTGIKEKV